MTQLVKANVKEERAIFIHNDLANAAFYFKKVIEEKQANNGVGITLDCMACITMLAFTWEAYLNFFGYKLVKDWNEKEDIDKKIERVFSVLKYTPDKSRRPYNSITLLMKLRNIFAHGKPDEKTVERQITNKAEKVTGRQVDLSGDWQRLCTAQNTLYAHDDLNEVFKQMVDASGLTLWDTMTKVEGSIEFVEHVDPRKPAAQAE